MVNKRYKRIVDNKMKWQGDTDLEKKVIRVNKAKSKKKSTVIDTIYHEEYHAKHPKATEKKTYSATKKAMKKLNAKQKNRYYQLYK